MWPGRKTNLCWILIKWWYRKCLNLLSFVFQTTSSLCLWPTHLKCSAFIPTLRLVTTHRQPGTCGATWWSFSHRLERLVLASVGKNSLTRFGFSLLMLNGYAVVVGYTVHSAKALVELSYQNITASAASYFLWQGYAFVWQSVGQFCSICETGNWNWQLFWGFWSNFDPVADHYVQNVSVSNLSWFFLCLLFPPFLYLHFLHVFTHTMVVLVTWCVQIATDVLNKLPVEFELDKIRKKYGLEVSPTTVVLLQELERFNLLITRMRRSLATLKRVSGLLFSLLVRSWHRHMHPRSSSSLDEAKKQSVGKTDLLRQVLLLLQSAA